MTREGQANLAAEGEPVGATMDITFNGRLITTLILLNGPDQVYRVNIPDKALQPIRSDGRHELLLFLNAGLDCDYEFHHTLAIVSAQSFFILPHKLVPPPIDLALLPRPIYQLDSFLPGAATVVIPDSPTSDELRAALITAASLGRMSGGNLPVQFTRSSQITPDQQLKSDLVFVGKTG